ncbi:hypothetical protein RPP50_03605, partial [Staphylococcus aureus]|nr:hypothetical protein [Staphylococcus aureus]
MKRLVTGLLALSLFLAACGQDSDQQKDGNKEKDDKAKTEQQDKKTNDSSKDKKDDSKDVNKDNKDNSANDNQQQSNSNATNNDQNQTNNNQSSNNQANNNQKSSYVAPYYGQNAAPVARQIYPFNGNKTQALQQLPNFQTALNAANNEANKF